jgi:DNA-binding GntR family transcriptional regulator
VSTASEHDLLARSVHRTLRDWILSGELAPGAPLSVSALAARLNVSRSPVRESVQHLVYEGIAVHTPHAGAKVAVLDDEAVATVLEVREVLDGLAAERAARRITDARVDELLAMVERQRALLDGPPDRSRDARLDLEFHTAIRDVAASRPLSEALSRIDAQSHLFRSELWTSDRGRRLAVAEHGAIAEALEAGDAARAGAAARAHVAGVAVRMTRSPTAGGR